MKYEDDWERPLALQVLEPVLAAGDQAPDRGFLYEEYSRNNKRYRLKGDPRVVVDLTRCLNTDSILLGTWRWQQLPGGEPQGPFRTVLDCLRDMTRRFGLLPKSSPRVYWQACPRKPDHLRLVPSPK